MFRFTSSMQTLSSCAAFPFSKTSRGVSELDILATDSNYFIEMIFDLLSSEEQFSWESYFEMFFEAS